MKRMICLLLTLCLLAACAPVIAENPELTEDEQKALDLLAQELEKDAERQIAAIGEVPDFYREPPAAGIADTDSFPEKFDLRERGVVTPVKSQAPWGTCWTFGTSAACETSLLTMLGLTAEEYRAKYGVDMDISERHLAWFTAMPLPERSEYPEGEYPYDASQAGEGTHIPDGAYPLMMGGTYILSASSLAAGIGVVAESLAPYESNDDSSELADLREGDWSLPDLLRFSQSFQLKDTNVLPSPAGTAADGSYAYRPEGTAAIKRELVSGRGVAAAYTEGRFEQEMPKDQQRENYESVLIGEDISDDDKEALIQILLGDLDPETLPDEQLWRIVLVRCNIQGLEQDTYSFSDLSHEDLALLSQVNMLGMTPDEIREEQAAIEESRILFRISKDPLIVAQYSNTQTRADHATCIIGWDDTFPASSFPEGHRPPGDGAWLCRNSHGTEWGMDGYFYLSYYDQTLGMCQSFEFENDADFWKVETFGILQYDYMPAEMISATLYETPVYAANVFTVGGEEKVLRYVSALTGRADTTLTVSVWLLKEDAVSPTDGKLLATVTDTFRYMGYHRMALPESLLLPAGARIGITVLQSVETEGSTQYALVNTCSQAENAPLIAQLKERADPNFYIRWFTGVVNPGESYVSFGEGRWLDWRTVLDNVSGEGNRACMAYDNLPVKGYVYVPDEIMDIHDLDTRIPTAGGEAAICPDCGYVLVIPET